jgi:inorganic pyrophosphatase
MANISSGPYAFMPNLLHLLPAFADEERTIVNVIVELNSHTLNKYELITETGHLKLDRVGYSSLSYPFTYGAIPMTWDLDGDPLDAVIINVTEPLIPGSLVEARIIGVMKFIDGGEVDDKIVCVLNDDKRVDHIKTIEDLGEYWMTESTYYWEHYKDLKKPGSGKVEGFLNTEEAVKVVEECSERYVADYLPKLEEDELCECCGGCNCGCECEGECDCEGENCDCEHHHDRHKVDPKNEIGHGE